MRNNYNPGGTLPPQKPGPDANRRSGQKKFPLRSEQIRTKLRHTVIPMPRPARFILSLLALLLCAFSMTATEYHGRVTYGGLPLPGATLTATQGDKKFVAMTDMNGTYSFPDLPDGDWSVQVEMLCFATVKKDVTIAFGVPTAEWEMKLLPIDEIHAASAAAAPTVSSASPEPSVTTSVPAAMPAPLRRVGKSRKRAR